MGLPACLPLLRTRARGCYVYTSLSSPCYPTSPQLAPIGQVGPTGMAARWLCVVLFSFFSAVHLSLQLHTYIHVSLYYYKYTCTVLPFEYAKAEQRLPYVVYLFFSFLLKWAPSLCDVVPIFFSFYWTHLFCVMLNLCHELHPIRVTVVADYYTTLQHMLNVPQPLQEYANISS